VILSDGTDERAIQTGVSLMLSDGHGGHLSMPRYLGPGGVMGITISNGLPGEPGFTMAVTSLDIEDRRLLAARLLAGLD
jgi:hypothetical protein